jgi:VanZ family protein
MWLFTASYAIFIFILSAQSQPLGMSRLPYFVDKVLHAVLFGGFSLVLVEALRRSRPNVPLGVLCGVAIGLTTLYGVSDEYHQSFVPQRDVEGYDVAADGFGALLAQCGVWLKGRRV